MYCIYIIDISLSLPLILHYKLYTGCTPEESYPRVLHYISHHYTLLDTYKSIYRRLLYSDLLICGAEIRAPRFRPRLLDVYDYPISIHIVTKTAWQSSNSSSNAPYPIILSPPLRPSSLPCSEVSELGLELESVFSLVG